MVTRRTARDARRTLSVLVSIAGIASATSALAQQESAEQIASARELGTEGVKLAEAGDCANAVDKLSRAESLHHAPTTLERLGTCHVKLGKLVLGTEELLRVMHESLAPGAPAAFATAQDRAKKTYEAAAPRIGKLRIHVDQPVGVKADVKVDDEAVLDAMLDADRPTDPGAHKITATGPGMKPAEASVTLKDAESVSISLKLDADPNAAIAAVPAPAPVPPPAPTENAAPPPAEAPLSSPHSNAPAIVALSVGGVGVAVGAVFGLLALSTKSTLDSSCDANKACPASSQSDINSLGTKATLSTIGFGVGIVGVGVGTYLLLTSSGGSSGSQASAKPHVTPFLGPGSAGFTGTF